jgi:hypothetical protein
MAYLLLDVAGRRNGAHVVRFPAQAVRKAGTKILGLSAATSRVGMMMARKLPG